MRILLPSGIVEQLRVALRRACSREIGGILMGEHVAEGIFRINEITIQRDGGSWFSFIRYLREALHALKCFFASTGHQFTRYNYLGEWHSHPRLPLIPSNRDRVSMCDIVEDPEIGARFAVLMIVRLEGCELISTATVFVSGRRMFEGAIIQEGAES